MHAARSYTSFLICLSPPRTSSPPPTKSDARQITVSRTDAAPCFAENANIRAVTSRERHVQSLHVRMRPCAYVFMSCAGERAPECFASGLAGTSSGLGCSVLSGHQLQFEGGKCGGGQARAQASFVITSVCPCCLFLFIPSLHLFMPDLSWRGFLMLGHTEKKKKKGKSKRKTKVVEVTGFMKDGDSGFKWRIPLCVLIISC